MPFHSDETIDGIMFGWALQDAIARNPAAQMRRNAYEDGLRADRAMLATLPRETLGRAIVERRLWTLPAACGRKTTDEMIEVIARCMRGSSRPAWLAALGV